MKIIIRIVLLIISCSAFSQTNVFLGQYFNVVPIFAPGLTGANDFVDIRTGSKYQWLGYEGAPKTYFVSGSYSFSVGKTNPYKYHSLRVGDMGPYKSKGLKIGVGGYVLDDTYGAYHQLEVIPTLAVHVPLNRNTYFSLGISPGLYHSNIDMEDVSVLLPDNDQTYQDYLANGSNSNYLKISTGLALYSTNYYFSYSLINAGMVHLSSNVLLEDYGPQLTHHIIAGFNIPTSSKLEFIPSTFIRYTAGLPTVFDVGLKARYEQNPYFGLSYRNDNSFLGLLGFTINDLFSFGYAYEFKGLQDSNMNSSSHEIILSIRLFNYGKYVPIW